MNNEHKIIEVSKLSIDQMVALHRSDSCTKPWADLKLPFILLEPLFLAFPGYGAHPSVSQKILSQILS